MNQPLRILLQTTIPETEDDWSIARFSLLTNYLGALLDQKGHPLCQVTARDRQANSDGNDPVLSALSRADFDQLWLFAVDIGDGLSAQDCAGITAFHQQGGGMLITRDHYDLGCSVCQLGLLGAAHYFHTHNPDPDTTRHCIDDTQTPTILWPNYHSGRNGDYQVITPTQPVHELLHRPASGQINYFPAHPHEGGIGIPDGATQARVIAQGKSLITGRPFNLAIAFDYSQDKQGHWLGRAVAESTFHHFCDYNWDSRMGCPSFVTEPPGMGMVEEPQALADLKTYLHNLVLWLAPNQEMP
jgi:hypothetical protein